MKRESRLYLTFPKVITIQSLPRDVLEHVEEPILLANKIASAVRKGGIVIFANCFHPVIQCHLPSTFHLRYTFPWVMKALGLRYVGTVEGAEHAQVFRVDGPLDLENARKAERVSRLIGPLVNPLRAVLSWIKRGLVQL